MSQKKMIYDSFNARNMSFEDVGKLFVPNKEYLKLLKNSDALIMGPRGCGKTTLLKMLTMSSLKAWPSELAEKTLNTIPFVAVYIGTDVHWKNQLSISDFKLHLSDNAQLTISHIAITTNILLSFANCIEKLLSHHGISDQSLEAAFCRLILKEWRLTCLPCFTGIILALRSRINSLNDIAATLGNQSYPSAKEPFESYSVLDYRSCLLFAGDAFYRTYGMLERKPWALCFDELELAPDWLQRRLYQEIRGPGDEFLLKISTSPLPSIAIWNDATPRHDFDVIELWPKTSQEYYPFFDNLVRQLFRRKFEKDIDPIKLFGSSPLWEDPERESTYQKGSPTWKMIREMALKDHALNRFLVKHGISPSNPTPPNQSKSDSIIRKAKPIVIHRREFIDYKNPSKPKLRSRKISTLYSGRDAIYDICDGNPRLLIGIVSDLLNSPGIGPTKNIPKIVQSRLLTEVSSEFVSLVKAMAVAPVNYNSREINLLSFLETVKRYFSSTILSPEFNLDPIGSFTIDLGFPNYFAELIKTATYVGAIVIVNSNNSIPAGDFRGRRYRLSYLLSPCFKLPLRLYDSVLLSKCLSLKRERGLLKNQLQTELPLYEIK